MGVPSGGGTNLGNAQGSITINVQQLAQAQAAVKAAANQMTQALNAVNPSVNRLQTSFGALNGSLRSIAAGIGLSFSAQGAMQIARYAVAADQLATAYRRQRIAAVDLAGSQAQLNDLLRTYDRVTGDTLDDAALLTNVLNLQATGFAKTTDQMERFAKAARGISIATGRGQASTNQQLIFELVNQTGFRLDQLGLDMQAVEARAQALRAANANLSKEQAYQNAVLDEAIAKYGKLLTSAEGQATGIEKLTASWNNLGLAIGEAVSGPLDTFGKGASFLIDIQIARLRAWMNELDAYIRLLRQVGMGGPWLTSSESSFVSGSVGRDIGRHRGNSGASAPSGDFTERNAAIVQWSRDVAAIERQAANDRIAATRDYEQQRASVLRQYGTTIAREAMDFNTSRLRAEQDHARAIGNVREQAAQRELQMAEDLARTIANARNDSAERLADLQANLDRTVAQRRADSAERVAELVEDRDKAIAERRKASADRLLELEADYNRERERAQRDFNLREQELAANLDARGLFFERQRFEQEAKDALEARDRQVSDEKKKLDEAVRQLNDAHAERLADEARALEKSINQSRDAYDRQVADEKKALDKRIAQAVEAYNQQLADAKAADEQRIADMEADFALRKQREDEDRATRLARMAEDHNAQLQEMAQAHSARMAQISAQAAQERARLDEEFLEQLDQLGIHNDKWKALQEQRQKESIELFDEFWEEIKKRFNLQIGPPTAPVQNPSLDPRRQQLEAEIEQKRIEQRAYPPGTPQWSALANQIIELQRQLDALNRGTPTGASLISASSLMSSTRAFAMPSVGMAGASGTGGGRNITVSNTFQISGVSGQTAQELYQIIDQRILDTVRRAAGAYSA